MPRAVNEKNDLPGSCMKVNLYTLEKEFASEAMAEATALLRHTRDYRLQETEPGHFLFTSATPDYQVEVTARRGGNATARCGCAAFRRYKACKHALAAFVAVRDLRRIDRKASPSDPTDKLAREVVKKLSKEELRDLVTSFAATHESFRIDLLANYMHRMPRPDYATLLDAFTRTDRHGQLALNRRQFKQLRSVVALLLSRAQERLQEQDADGALHILENLVPFLYRIGAQDARHREALLPDLRMALKWFDALFRRPMAPRLYERGVAMVLDLLGRDHFHLLPGTRSLTEVIMPHVLERPDRTRALALFRQRLAVPGEDALAWASQLVQGLRAWPEAARTLDAREILSRWLPELVRDLAQQGKYDEALFAWRLADPTHYPPHRLKPALVAVWQAARTAGHLDLAVETAAYLTVAFRHLETLDWLLTQDPAVGTQIALQLHEQNPFPQSEETEHIIVHGLARAGQDGLAWERLRDSDDVDLVNAIEPLLADTHDDQLDRWYANHIRMLREAYGGTIARDKLHHIFSHLKSSGREKRVRELLTMTEPQAATHGIRGFVFDLDGVIVDTAVHHFESWRAIMRQLGAEIRDEDDRHTRGASRMESFNYLLDRYGVELSEADKLVWADRKNSLYLESIARITPDDLLPGAADFLAASRKAGLRLALGSASKNARSVLDRLGISDRFDAIIDGNDVTHSKPDPEVFTKACEALGLQPDTVVVFEDADKGVQAAVAAGCHTVGIGDPSILGQADIVVPGLHAITPQELLERIA